MESYTSSTSNFEENYSKLPYMEMGIAKAVNMQGFSESPLSPYVHVHQFDKEWESKIAFGTDSTYIWGESLILDIDMSQSFIVMIFDKREFGQEALLSAFLVPPHFMKTLELGLTQEMWVKIQEPETSFAAGLQSEDFPVLGEHLMGNKFDETPMISLSLKYVDPELFCQYMVRVKKHVNVIKDNEMYTSYEINVSRDDGANWKVHARFSQIANIRNKLVRVLPQVRKVKFPNNSYFSFMGFCWRKLSKFSPERIDARKKGIEDFLNAVLPSMSNIRCQSLYSLLQVRRPVD